MSKKYAILKQYVKKYIKNILIIRVLSPYPLRGLSSYPLRVLTPYPLRLSVPLPIRIRSLS